MANEPHHTLAVTAALGPLHLNVDLALTAPWTILFGPSGSGKSTLLRAACGLLPASPTTHTSFAHRCSTGILLPLEKMPPHRRHIAYAPQQATLFPHLTVLENIRFATLVRDTANRAQRTPSKIVYEAIDLFSLHTLTNRLPRDLSGGERQRVNLARAFALPRTHILLLDEPFSGLDRALRDTYLPRIQAWLAKRTLPVLSVTHDIEEPLLLQAEVIRLQNGKATAQGPAKEVLAEERQSLLANLTA